MKERGAPGSGAAGEHRSVVDFHVHVLDDEVLGLAGHHNVSSGFGARPSRPPAGTDAARNFERMLSPERHLEDMDARGIDVHVLSPATVILGMGWADGKAALDADRRLNDRVAEWVRQYPSRFVGMATLPLQDLDLAIGELERAVDELGLRAINLPAQIGGVYLGDPPLRPLWRALHERELATFLHPDGVCDPWYQQYALWNSIGQSIEECKAMTSIILGGLLEELPGLKIVVAHGGSFLPHYPSRLDRNARIRPETARHMTKLPSAYLRDFYYDTCVYDPSTLDALSARVGADRLLLGGDYPVGEADPVGLVRRAASLPADELPWILGLRAQQLLEAH